MTRLTMDTHAVIWMRTMGMMGLWNVTDEEDARMVNEKPKAFMEAGMRASKAALSGAAPDRVAKAGLAPLARKAGANRRRLEKRGAAK